MFEKNGKATVTELVREAKELSNVSEAEERAVLAKRRSLKLTFANLSKSTKVCFYNEMFKTGKFFNQPVSNIGPGQKQDWFSFLKRTWKNYFHPQSVMKIHEKTVFVMNTEGLHLAGVSGGVSLELKSDHRNTEYLICTFSNPLVGCVKASVFLSSEGGIDQIDALWEPMDQCSLEKGTFYGIYRESDKHITFVWKDQKTPW